MSDKKTEKKFAERRKRLDYYKKFTPEKLTELENKMGNIIAKYKKGQTILIISSVIGNLLLGVSVAFSFRYLVSFQEMLDYSGFFLLAPLQKLVDSLFFECEKILQYVFPFVLVGILILISRIITITALRLMHYIKSAVLKNETAEPVTGCDYLEKIALLKEKIENIYKLKIENKKYNRLVEVSFMVGVVLLVAIGFSGGLKENIGRLLIMLVITVAFCDLVPVYYSYKIESTNSKLGDYRDERDEAVKILGGWNRQLDKALDEKLHKEWEEDRKRQEIRDLEAKMSKLNQKGTSGPDYIIVPRPDVSDM